MKWAVVRGQGGPTYAPDQDLDLQVTVYQSRQWDGADPQITHQTQAAGIVQHVTPRSLLVRLAGQPLVFSPNTDHWTPVANPRYPW